MVGKLMHVNGALSYLFQSTILRIIRSDFSDPSFFLTVGLEMSSVVVSYSLVSPRRLEDIASRQSSAWARAGALIWRVWRMQNHGDVLYRLEWRIVIAHKEGTGRSFVGPFTTK